MRLYFSLFTFFIRNLLRLQFLKLNLLRIDNEI
ncbi:3-ketoacyl-ACP reductase [Campylobacter jejuni]|nr:3-ketoacyl-ACP reductase [Campylobacter jejuni]EAJ8926556.1 3-ketoacyl-ACP reductase [Campylobacter jejuni]EAJ9188144.1 3-ketoacyl-ACP reductase [Campylobacter jejuni]EAL5039605.1 3-ketoacyl-ACP reductase [Campylobacter jejuni]EAM0654310.1 3-ketoacyl-ACP reductase [Campylobacter jejuni]ECK9932695.1 3-ketoacyl-ACP reductase [Campylobacter jejuni]